MRNFHEVLGIEPPAVRVLDIGALPEDEPRYAALIGQKNVEVVAIEPQTNEEAPWLWADGDNIRTAYITRYPGCTSLLEPDPDVIGRFSMISAEPPGGNFAVVETKPVNTEPLDRLEPGRLDLIKLDTQGSELQILWGAFETLKSALVVECEVEFLKLYKKQALFHDVASYMHERGFFLHQLRDCGGQSYRPVMVPYVYLPQSQLLYADAVFVRNHDSLDAEASYRAARILWDCYGSYDLAVHLVDKVNKADAAELLKEVRAEKTLPMTAVTMRAPQRVG
jgi:hypothetical protein